MLEKSGQLFQVKLFCYQKYVARLIVTGFP